MNNNKLSIFDQHRRKIAIATLKMPDAMLGVMGGMTKQEARDFLKSIGENPTRYEAQNAHK